MGINCDRRSCLKRAEALLSRDDDSTLLYACLELRLCLEAIAYDKLKLYAPRLPAEALRTWQPPQAMRALLVYEPHATESFTLSVSRDGSSGEPTGPAQVIGAHHGFSLSWLRTTYNKLGSFLHVPPPSEPSPPSRQPAELRKALQGILDETRPVAESTLDCSLAAVIEFNCAACHNPVVANAETVRSTRTAVCLNPDCGAEHFAFQADSGEFLFQLKASRFKCLSCDHENEVQNAKLDIGAGFKCESCGEQHQFVGRQWEYARVRDINGSG